MQLQHFLLTYFLLYIKATEQRSQSHLHDIKETLLSNAILVFEQFVAGERPRDVSTDRLLERRGLLQIAGVGLFLGAVHIHAT